MSLRPSPLAPAASPPDRPEDVSEAHDRRHMSGASSISCLASGLPSSEAQAEQSGKERSEAAAMKRAPAKGGSSGASASMEHAVPGDFHWSTVGVLPVKTDGVASPASIRYPSPKKFATPSDVRYDRAAKIIKRLEAGIHERDVLLNAEREQHKNEIAQLSRRLASAEARDANMHDELLAAKQDAAAVQASNHRIEELTRSGQASSDKLAVLTEAQALNQEKHRLLLEALEIERRRSATLSAELDRARDELGRVKEELTTTRRVLEAERMEASSRSSHLTAEYEALVAKYAALEEQMNAEARLRDEMKDSEVAAKAVARMKRMGIAMAWNSWCEFAVAEAIMARKIAVMRQCAVEWRSKGLRFCWAMWQRGCKLARKRTAIQRAALRMRNSYACRAWNQWRAVYLWQTHRLQSTMRSHGLALRGVCYEAKQTNEVHLGALLDCIQDLESQRREERARLETEVAALVESHRSLNDSLAAKRETCERLRRANARLVAQFEAAESEFLDAERLREEATPTTLVGRLVDAVFGLEPPAPNAFVAGVKELDGRGTPSDRLAVLAGGHGSGFVAAQPTGGGRPSTAEGNGRRLVTSSTRATRESVARRPAASRLASTALARRPSTQWSRKEGGRATAAAPRALTLQSQTAPAKIRARVVEQAAV